MSAKDSERTQRARHFRSGRCYSRYYIISFAQNKEEYEKYPYIALKSRKRFSFSDDSERKSAAHGGAVEARRTRKSAANKRRDGTPCRTPIHLPYLMLLLPGNLVTDPLICKTEISCPMLSLTEGQTSIFGLTNSVVRFTPFTNTAENGVKFSP